MVCDAEMVTALPLARAISGKASRRTGVDHDDLHGAALVGLCQAAQRFDPARKVPFAAYASTRIKGAVLDALRQTRPRGYRRCQSSWPYVVGLEPWMNDAQAPAALHVEHPASRMDAARDVAVLLRILSPQLRAVLVARLAGLTQKQTGRLLAVGGVRASQLESEAIATLRAHVGQG